jgi:tetratricopeptide (TPR) repeat protein
MEHFEASLRGLYILYRYQAGGTLDAAEQSYVYRQADLTLYEYLKSGAFCYVFNSRQMGKSSLMVKTMNRLISEGVCCISVDLTLLDYELTRDWYVDFISTLHNYLVEEFSSRLILEDWLSSHQNLSPVRLFYQYLKEVLLEQTLNQRIIVFIDEIDVVLRLGTHASDFFALIRACFNQRATDKAFNRITFALFGVATPDSLIQDKTRTPFNIGQSVALEGFDFSRSQALVDGLVGCVPDPSAMLKEILDWTGGQPFLTQKLCDLVQRRIEKLGQSPVSKGEATAWLRQLVQSEIIDNWKSQDTPKHLRTIHDRILSNDDRVGRSLELYQQVIKEGGIEADNSDDQNELCLAGLVVRRHGRLEVYNRIYSAVFNEEWVRQNLESLKRPYANKLREWLASGRQDEQHLLQEQELDEYSAWAEGKYLSDADYRFLEASQHFALQKAQQDIEQVRDDEDRAKQDLNKTKRLTKRMATIGVSIFGVLAVLSGIAVKTAREAQEKRTAADWEQRSSEALKQFDTDQIGALMSAMRVGREMQAKVGSNLPLEKYPTHSPVLVLQTILTNIRERNRLHSPSSDDPRSIHSTAISPDGELLITANSEGKVRLWNQSGKMLREINLRYEKHKDTSGGDLGFFAFDGKKIAAVSDYGRIIQFWDLSGKKLAQFTISNDSQFDIERINFRPGGNQIEITHVENTRGTEDSKDARLIKKRIDVWDRTGKLLSTSEIQPSHETKNIVSVADTYASDGTIELINTSLLEESEKAILQRDGTIRLEDDATDEVLYIQKDGLRTRDIDFNPQGREFFTTKDDGTVSLWDLSGQPFKGFRAKDINNQIFFVNDLRFSSDGKRIIVRYQHELNSPVLKSKLNEDIISIWNLAGHKLHEFRVRIPKISTGEWATRHEITEDGKIITAQSNEKIRLLNLSGKQISEFKEIPKHFKLRLPIVPSPDGRLIASFYRFNNVVLWNSEGKPVTKLNTFNHAAVLWHMLVVGDWDNYIRFSSDGKQLATVDDKGVRLWNLSGKKLADIEQKSIDDVRFSFNNRLIATTTMNAQSTLWDSSGQKIALLRENQEYISNLKFVPNKELIATVSRDGTVRIWNHLGKLMTKINRSISEQVRKVEFSPNGQQIAIIGDDLTVRLWSLSGQQLAEFKRYHFAPQSISFSPDGSEIAIGGSELIKDGELSVQRVSLNNLLEQSLSQGCDWLYYYLTSHPDVSIDICPDLKKVDDKQIVQKQLDETIVDLQRAIQRYPHEGVFSKELGFALWKQDKLDKAIAAFRKAIQLDPDWVDGYWVLGHALKELRKYNEAIASYRKAIRLDPNSSYAYGGLGDALRQQHKYNDAITAYRKAIQLNPNNAYLYQQLGTTLMKLKKNNLGEAITALQKAIQLDPKDAFTYERLGDALVDAFIDNYLGDSLSGKNKLGKAVSAYRTAIRLDPNDAYPYKRLGFVLGIQNKLNEAVTAYRQAIQIDPDDSGTYYGIGKVLHSQNKIDQAISAYRKAIQLNPNDSDNYSELGNALKSQHKFDEAIVAYKKAIKLNPNDASNHAGLGYALSLNNKFDEAIQALQIAATLFQQQGDNVSYEQTKLFIELQKITEPYEAIRKKQAIILLVSLLLICVPILYWIGLIIKRICLRRLRNYP